jgi:hypothetical protein
VYFSNIVVMLPEQSRLSVVTRRLVFEEYLGKPPVIVRFSVGFLSTQGRIKGRAIQASARSANL